MSPFLVLPYNTYVFLKALHGYPFQKKKKEEALLINAFIFKSK